MKEWIEGNDEIERRLCWFEVYAPNSPLCHKVDKPLLSMHTTESLDTERVAKPIKNTFLIKKYNRLADDSAITLIHASENLKHFVKIKTDTKKMVISRSARARMS